MSRVIPRVDISEELQDWAEAVYGEEVRSANVSALTKLQQQTNDACDMFEEIADDFDERDVQWGQDLTEVREKATAAAGSATEAAESATAAVSSEAAAAGSASAAAASENAAAASEAAAAASKDAAGNAADRAEAAASDVENPVSYAPQTLTEAQQEQARKNIKAGGSNRNLLDNPWFASNEVINQRGATSGQTDGVYFIDRWITTYGGTKGNWYLVNTGLTFAVTGSIAGMFQKMEQSYNGKVLTASVMMANGSIYHGTITRIADTVQTIFDDGEIELRMYADNSFGVWYRTDKTVRAVKLELGSISTLANDTAPDYATELLKCQRYFYRYNERKITYCHLGTWRVESNTQAVSTNGFKLPICMRENPTVTIVTGTNYMNGIADGAIKYLTPISAIVYQTPGDICNVRITFSQIDFPISSIFALSYTGYSGYFDFSADL